MIDHTRAFDGVRRDLITDHAHQRCAIDIYVSGHSRIYAQPSTKDETFGFCDDLLDLANCQIVEPGERHWHIFRRLCIETDTRGRRVTDAWYAALAIEWGCEWITLDREYARFPGLKWSAPAMPAR